MDGKICLLIMISCIFKFSVRLFSVNSDYSARSLFPFVLVESSALEGKWNESYRVIYKSNDVDGDGVCRPHHGEEKPAQGGEHTYSAEPATLLVNSLPFKIMWVFYSSE